MTSNFDAKSFCQTLTTEPGVYLMHDDKGEVIYVGKAKNLKNRVSSYFNKTVAPKTQALVANIAAIEITVTHSETEALLLESTLIKKHRPRYNVLLRDDKSYPYIFLSAHEDFPRLDVHRGAKKAKGRYFGPYISAGSVRSTLNVLQKLFKLRQCRDSFFKARTRPCLQYQIKRCTAPCVDFISAEAYQRDVQRTVLFLEGKSEEVVESLLQDMQAASAAQDYEHAAQIRDLITRLRDIQAQQFVTTDNKQDSDVIAVVTQANVVCVNVMNVRAGRISGNKSFFPKVPGQVDEVQVLAEFIPQYYFNRIHAEHMPRNIITSIDFADRKWLEDALSEINDRKVVINAQVRGVRAQWQKLAITNAQTALASQLASKSNMLKRFEALQKVLKLSSTANRIECFDISHSQGEATVASCVVFDLTGPLKSDYRRYNIRDITPGDDYAAMNQALLRRFAKLKENDAKLPDILLIDGGKGQLNCALEALEECQVSDVLVVGISKGEGRKAEFDRLFLAGDKTPISIDNHSLAMHLIQQIRDEAHRFAITGHRQQRGKKRKTSTLEDIPGVGSKRRQALLKYFGGLQGVLQASKADLAQVPGISPHLAEQIYDSLHE